MLEVTVSNLFASLESVPTAPPMLVAPELAETIAKQTDDA
jgi:hypothetical protein